MSRSRGFRVSISIIIPEKLKRVSETRRFSCSSLRHIHITTLAICMVQETHRLSLIPGET